MKTFYFSSKKFSIYMIFGLIAVLTTACGSYQNKSYYDNDGIYGSVEMKREAPKEQMQRQSSKYDDYFYNLQKDKTVATAKDSIAKDTVVKKQVKVVNNADSYLDNNDRVVLVYDNWNYGNYWGYNHNWNNYYGWNGPFYSSWYGPSWGYGYNNYWYGGYYGWNDPYYGWNNPYYGWNNNGYGCNNGFYNGYNNYSNYNNGYTYSNQRGNRRDSGARENYGSGNESRFSQRTRDNYSGRDNGLDATSPRAYAHTRTETNSNPRSYAPTRSESAPVRDYEPATNSNPRSYAPTRSETAPVRDYEPATNSNPRSYTPTRSETAPVRNYEPTRSESAPTRSYTAPSRSYEPSYSQPSYGGGGNSGGGGGRSSGGGGGRR